ncbi:hypothetical protein WMY93_007019 [Mugilogobius chulae]|uniref:lysozyme n=1 Tax=Mugilogobius chulae TaxID=88201 RepID=A0AAW0PX16_9GOBI
MERAGAVAALVLVVALFGAVVEGKEFDECTLRSQLKYGIPTAGTAALNKIVCHVQQGSDFNSAAVKPKSVSGSSEEWTRYGLFQISHPFCDRVSSEFSICEIDCAALIDDDITDDIACVNKIISAITLIKPSLNGLLLQRVVLLMVKAKIPKALTVFNWLRDQSTDESILSFHSHAKQVCLIAARRTNDTPPHDTPHHDTPPHDTPPHGTPPHDTPPYDRNDVILANIQTVFIQKMSKPVVKDI